MPLHRCVTSQLQGSMSTCGFQFAFLCAGRDDRRCLIVTQQQQRTVRCGFEAGAEAILDGRILELGFWFHGLSLRGKRVIQCAVTQWFQMEQFMPEAKTLRYFSWSPWFVRRSGLFKQFLHMPHYPSDILIRDILSKLVQLIQPGV